MKKYSELLSNAGLFRGIKDNEIEAMIDCLSATVRHYQKGDFVFHRGECITSVAMLLEGCIHIQKEDYSVSVF